MTNQKSGSSLVFFSQVHIFQPNTFFPGGPFRTVAGAGAIALYAPPAYAPAKTDESANESPLLRGCTKQTIFCWGVRNKNSISIAYEKLDLAVLNFEIFKISVQFARFRQACLLALPAPSSNWFCFDQAIEFTSGHQNTSAPSNYENMSL